MEICGDDVTDLFNVTGGQPVAVIPTEEPGGFRLVNAFRVVLPSAEKAAETLQTGVGT